MEANQIPASELTIIFTGIYWTPKDKV